MSKQDEIIECPRYRVCAGLHLMGGRRDGRRRLYRLNDETLHRCCSDHFHCLGTLSPPPPSISGRQDHIMIGA